jgi:hypothetical protein
LLRVRDEDIAVVRGEELEWLSFCLVERLLDDLRAPEEICPCLVSLGDRLEDDLQDPYWRRSLVNLSV